MILPLSLSLLFLAILDAPAPASAFSLSSTTDRFHRYALRKSARLARDLRVVFQAAVEQTDSVADSHKVYCIRPDDTANALGNASATSPATGTGTSTHTSTGSASSSTATSAYSLVEEHSGSDFFDGWSFWDTTDPTNGAVDYQSQSDAESAGLIDINDDGNALLKVETTSTISGNRKSVRITTDNTFTQGIFVLDAVHMPQGCATWPAFWSNGPDWPDNGEIDIMEGVNDNTNNQATLHTASGCTLPSNATASSLSIAATLTGGLNCAAEETSNAGCGEISTSSETYGSGFNSVGGGVYAMAWTDEQIAVYFFERGSIPDDITSNAPLPDTWGQPQALWPSTDCDFSKYFNNHSIIIDTTLCGDWAGDVWNSTDSTGQTTSCASRTGYSTCEEFVQKSGASFSTAYWEISYMKVFQTSRTS